VLHTFQATLPHVTAPGGLLLVTGSSLALRPVPGLLPYVAAKAGAHAVARALALELAPRGIRVNVVAPGLTETPMTVGIPGHIEAGLPSVPLGTLVAAEEVAALAVHLMTDASRSITGSVFTVDGGRTAG
jgi:3-oxoacyl-[acyl-carrier protein] reductase